ncbi:MAG: universal stress protein [Nitrospirae bacterium]|nr:universal stress protein [Nitrospirota bacterium]
MESKKTIFAAVDLGPDTEKVLSYSVWLSQTLAEGPPEIYMLDVMDYALTPPAYLLPYMEKEEESCGQELKEWVGRLKRYGVAATGRIAVGRLIETFDNTLRDFPAAVLVLCHKSHIVRTSSSERLIKSLDVPMLVVRGGKADSAVLGSVAVSNILCAVDFSEHSRKALEFACSLAEKNSSSIIVTHVLSSLELDKSFDRLNNLSEADKQKYLNHAIHEAEESMLSMTNIPDKAERTVKIGVPYKKINDIASGRDIDLIVMGAQGASSTGGVLLGSIAEAVVKSAPCPVMLVRK